MLYLRIFYRSTIPILSLILTSCTLVSAPEPFPTPGPVTVFPPTPTPVRTQYGWTDENAVMSGVCFEAAFDAAGKVYVFKNAIEHIRFYGLADQSVLCRHPVQRNSFDFSNGRVLAGLWSKGIGCTARHDVLDVQQDTAAKFMFIRLKFVTEGDCNYELVRPFWIGLDGVSDYEIRIEVE